MVWIDVVCLICIIIFAAIGVWKGLLKSIFHLCAWIFAILGAYFAQDLLSGVIARNFEAGRFAITLICICIGFLVPFLAFSFIGHIVHKAVSNSSISKVNRILGALLGVIKASVICFVFLSILHILPITGTLKENRNSSFSYSAYRFSLEAMGFSSEEVDLAGIAEKKANELSQEIADKATETVKEKASSIIKEKTGSAKESDTTEIAK